MPYQKTRISTGAPIGDPGPLPERLIGYCDSDLASLPALFTDESLAAMGLADVTFSYVPPPGRPQLPKSTVMARIEALGHFSAVWSLLQSQPLMFMKWITPDWPDVYCDDPGLLMALAAVGLSQAEIDLVTAAP